MRSIDDLKTLENEETKKWESFITITMNPVTPKSSYHESYRGAEGEEMAALAKAERDEATTSLEEVSY